MAVISTHCLHLMFGENHDNGLLLNLLLWQLTPYFPAGQDDLPVSWSQAANIQAENTHNKQTIHGSTQTLHIQP